MTLKFIKPSWSVPKNIHALTTTRIGGFSLPPYNSFNLATHVGDKIDLVTQNRVLLQETLALPNNPTWLNQIHSGTLIDAATPSILEADGSYTNQPNIVCVVQTADCLPILLCNQNATEIAALHGGWKSLSKNIIQNGIEKFQSPPNEIIAWLGPAIGPKKFEVGEDVKEIFINLNRKLVSVFTPLSQNKWLMNIYETAKILLQSSGVDKIYYENYCTYSDPERFYSYRRNNVTGRMASLIWIE